MQIETLASRGSNYYEDQKKEDKYYNLPETEEMDNLNSYERLEQCKFIGFNHFLVVEIDQELSETDLMSRYERKQEYKSN
jgi:hypothetical protein